MAGKGIWIPCVILAVVWLFHILCFTLLVTKIPTKRFRPPADHLLDVFRREHHGKAEGRRILFGFRRFFIAFHHFAFEFFGIFRFLDFLLLGPSYGRAAHA